MRYLPNAITVLRILITPLVLVLVVSDTAASLFWAWLVFIIASISDYLDGKLARRFDVPTRFGQFLDPLADKILVVGTFAAIAFRHPDVVPWWAVGLIAARDVFVTLLRSRSERSGRSLKTSAAAKAKTVFQLTYLISILLVLCLSRLPTPAVSDPAQSLLASTLPLVALVAVVVVTVGTGVLYALKTEYSTGRDR
jgi:CDP-diacylglycerol--glycerol-3-phosphate 3-phosphatidyltransferase